MGLRSLQARLLWGISLCLLILLAGGGIASYAFFRMHLYDELDHALLDKLRYLRASCVQDDNGVTFDLTEAVWGTVQDEHDPEFFQIWLEDGTTLHRSWEGGGGDLPNLGSGTVEPVYADLELPSGMRGRIAAESFRPHGKDGGPGALIVNASVAHDTGRIIAGLATARRLIIIWGIIGAGAVLLAAYTIVNRNLRPLTDLSRQIDEIPLGAEESRFNLKGAPEELEPVVDRLNDLMERVDLALENERQFTANAAHELRNPLAGIRSQIELSLNRPRTEEDYRETLDGVLQVEKRLESLVANLLLLTRLQSGQQMGSAAPVAVCDFLRRSWKPFFQRAEERELEVSLRCDSSAGEWVTSEELLEIVLRNLFDNAVSYADAGGRIEISASEESDFFAIRVANTCTELTQEDLEKMFGRFWRASRARDGDHLHAGIGLSLTRRAIEAIGGKLEASLEEGGLLTMTVRLPDSRKSAEKAAGEKTVAN